MKNGKQNASKFNDIFYLVERTAWKAIQEVWFTIEEMWLKD